MLRSATLAVVAIAALAILVQPGHAQSSEAPIEVMILGTFPFSTPGLTSTREQAADILTDRRQDEIGTIVDALSGFRPTEIAIEVEPERSDRIESMYDAFRENGASLAPDEIQQLGFRLAQRMDIDELHAIDHPGEFLFAEVMSYAQRVDPGIMVQVLQTTAAETAEQNEIRENQSLGALLRHVNEPEQIDEAHALYMALAEVGAGDSFIGADFLAGWYARNIHIFANLQAIAEPGDRVLVMFGAGHAAILRQLVESDPRMQLVEATDYLPS